MSDTSKPQTLKYIDLLSLITQAPLSLVSEDGETIYCPMAEEHHFLNADMAKDILAKFHSKNLPDNAPFIHLYSLSILQGVVRLSKTMFIFIGPVCITQPSLEDSLAAFRSVTTNEEAMRLHSILAMFGALDFFRFAGILAALSNNYNLTDYTPSEIIDLNFIQNIKSKPFDQSAYNNTKFIPIASINYFLNSLTSIITSGNMDALIKHWQDDLMNTLINLNLTSDNLPFLCIPFYPYMFQGAISGGVDMQQCFDTYVGQIARFKHCKNIVECITELKRSSYEYCNLVKANATQEYMPDVCDLCVSYINDHIQEKITVDDLTHLTGIHRNKLTISSAFTLT